MNGYDRRRDLEAKAIDMADSVLHIVVAGISPAPTFQLEAPAPGALFQNANLNSLVTMHCRLVEGYYEFLFLADSSTTGMWQVPPGDPTGAATVTPPAGSGTPAQTIGAALQALLKALPQSGAVTQVAAQAALKTALAGTGIAGPLTNAILSLVPVAVSDWSQLLPVLQTGFAQLSQPATTN